jgi:hypothetical protein
MGSLKVSEALTSGLALQIRDLTLGQAEQRSYFHLFQLDRLHAMLLTTAQQVIAISLMVFASTRYQIGWSEEFDHRHQ